MPTNTGMTCDPCERTVEDALRGVSDVAVDREAARADAEDDADVAALVRAVEDAGHEAHA